MAGLEEWSPLVLRGGYRNRLIDRAGLTRNRGKFQLLIWKSRTNSDKGGQTLMFWGKPTVFHQR